MRAHQGERAGRQTLANAQAAKPGSWTGPGAKGPGTLYSSRATGSPHPINAGLGHGLMGAIRVAEKKTKKSNGIRVRF
jgi:hypothetical protein